MKIRNRSRDPADKLIILKEKKTDIVGKFGCKGYDTFGPLNWWEVLQKVIRMQKI